MTIIFYYYQHNYKSFKILLSCVLANDHEQGRIVWLNEFIRIQSVRADNYRSYM